MNLDAIRRVRDHLLTIPPHRIVMKDWLSPGTANTDELRYGCGTAGCLAGWTCALLAPRGALHTYQIMPVAQALLGLNTQQAYKLFTDGAETCTPQQAIQRLTSLLIACSQSSPAQTGS